MLCVVQFAPDAPKGVHSPVQEQVETIRGIPPEGPIFLTCPGTTQPSRPTKSNKLDEKLGGKCGVSSDGAVADKWQDAIGW